MIFADIITAIRKDGVVVTVVAALGLVVMVLLLVGRNRRAVAVLAGTAVGSLVMIAVCALIGLKINFLDFVALPIALGLGIDYAINVAHRADRDDPRHRAALDGRHGAGVLADDDDRLRVAAGHRTTSRSVASASRR